jgi:hypothetical protein
MAGIGALGGLSLLAACGDPVPPAAQAGVSIHVQEYDNKDPNHTMDRCPPSRHWVNVPYDSDHQPTNQSQMTTSDVADHKAVNNQDGNTVTCSVKPTGSTFNVSANASGYALNMGKKYNPSTVHLRIPSIGSGDSNATGTLSLLDDASVNTYSTEQCTYSVQGGSMGVEGGRIWGSIHCENLADPESPGANCQVDTGFFVFENCGQ